MKLSYALLINAAAERLVAVLTKPDPDMTEASGHVQTIIDNAAMLQEKLRNEGVLLDG